jgi:hypothetical protein
MEVWKIFRHPSILNGIEVDATVGAEQKSRNEKRKKADD